MSGTASTTISFQSYASTNRVPGVYAEIDTVNPTNGVGQQRTLLIGQYLANGVVANQPALLVDDGVSTYGAGSMLARMIAASRLADPYGEIWVLPVADNPAASFATGAVSVSGTATNSGTINLYVSGVNCQVGVANGANASTIVTNMATVINAAGVPVTAVANVATSSVTLQARGAGAAVGRCDVQTNFYGAMSGEFNVPGITVTTAPLNPGTADPDLAVPLSLIPSKRFDFICNPFNGTSQVNEVTSWLASRWNWRSQLRGMSFTAMSGTASALIAAGPTYNSQFVSILGHFGIPVPGYVIAANYTSTVANSVRADPALPLQDIIMQLPAPHLQDRFTDVLDDSLLHAGISTLKYNDANQVILQRSITTYETNASGAQDTIFLPTEVMFQTSFVLDQYYNDFATKFSRQKLVADNTRVSYGQNVVTSQTILLEAISLYRRLAANYIVQNPDVFAANARAVNAGNGQVSLYLPIDLANQLRVIVSVVALMQS